MDSDDNSDNPSTKTNNFINEDNNNNNNNNNQVIKQISEEITNQDNFIKNIKDELEQISKQITSQDNDYDTIKKKIEEVKQLKKIFSQIFIQWEKTTDGKYKANVNGKDLEITKEEYNNTYKFIKEDSNSR